MYADMAPGAEQNNAAQNIASTLVNHDPGWAAKWTESLPPTAKRNTLPQILNQWLTQDFKTAATWLKSQPEGVERDNLIEETAKQCQHRNQEQNILLAALIINKNKRHQLSEQIFRNWLLRDRNRATEWRDNSDLPKEIKERLLNPNDRFIPPAEARPFPRARPPVIL